MSIDISEAIVFVLGVLLAVYLFGGRQKKTDDGSREPESSSGYVPEKPMRPMEPMELEDPAVVFEHAFGVPPRSDDIDDMRQQAQEIRNAKWAAYRKETP